MNPNIPLEEYFTYHPPKTSERKQKHEAINRNCCDLFIAYKDIVTDNVELKKGKETVDCLKNRLISNIKNLIEDSFSKEWALESLNLLDLNFPPDATLEEDLSEVLKAIQVARMASNQGITIDEVATDY